MAWMYCSVSHRRTHFTINFVNQQERSCEFRFGSLKAKARSSSENVRSDDILCPEHFGILFVKISCFGPYWFLAQYSSRSTMLEHDVGRRRVRPSVPALVTRWYWLKTNDRTIMQFLSPGSPPQSLVLWYQLSYRRDQGNSFAWGSNETVVDKNGKKNAIFSTSK